MNGTQSMKAQLCMTLIPKPVPWPVRMMNPANTFDGIDWKIIIFKKILAIALSLTLTSNRNWYIALRKVLFINLIIIMNTTIIIFIVTTLSHINLTWISDAIKELPFLGLKPRTKMRSFFPEKNLFYNSGECFYLKIENVQTCIT